MSKMTLDGYEDVTPDDIRAFQRDHAAGVTTETFPEWYDRTRKLYPSGDKKISRGDAVYLDDGMVYPLTEESE